MIFSASEEDMREYSSIVQQLAYLDCQRSALLERVKQWEDAHSVSEDTE